ncbi:hypothetical protein H4R99_001512 [Coemansia sp. RSA 1722]|nr:hypothetical protein LPJ57_001100 [Coemansia sp. RSA 486]KAJ2238175.1 hypothetical protein IWW45_000364 [Coemansia sp. RSA 485]KAJ2600581.1 hypothetical protein GGF39_001699 [Coemansia sp. RSA 1721]KAJ2604892.1 hypothetical protein H4R99_001512 [Coemansia sp. RSA 1722]
MLPPSSSSLISSVISAPALISLGVSSFAMAATPGGKLCAAQNILTNCLSIQGIQFTACSYSDWACKCQAQKALVQCYNNCPGDDARASQEGQVTVYCNAAMREEEQKSADSSKTITAKVNKSKDGGASLEMPVSTGDVDVEEDTVRSRSANGGKKSGGRRVNKNESIVHADSAANRNYGDVVWSYALLSAAASAAMVSVVFA